MGWGRGVGAPQGVDEGVTPWSCVVGRGKGQLSSAGQKSAAPSGVRTCQRGAEAEAARPSSHPGHAEAQQQGTELVLCAVLMGRGPAGSNERLGVGTKALS